MTFLFGFYDSSETDGQAAHHHVVVMSRQRLFLLGLVLKNIFDDKHVFLFRKLNAVTPKY